jgi:hypothetical protein
MWGPDYFWVGPWFTGRLLEMILEKCNRIFLFD